MISCGARLAVFDIAELREVTAYDELELDTLGDRKTALFLIMSDTDDSFNFLISMCYTQLFNLLCEKADDVYGGRLPVHVRCLIDECANIGQIPKLEKLVATIRSREISACLVLQAQSQLKAIYKDNADTIIGNMDTSIFLGGKEPTTLKELAAVLGKDTIADYIRADTTLPAYLPYPRFLLKMEISQTAKLLYALLLDRSTLSQKNGWQDGEGRIFIVYPVAEIAEMLDKGCTAIKGALKELDAAGLLERERRGFSAPNRLYVKVPPVPVVRFSDQLMAGKATLIQSEKRPYDGRKTDPMMVGKPTPNKTNINNLIENQTMRASGEPPTAYGRYENIFLSKDEYDELQAEYPDRLERLIEEMSHYLAASGKAYQNYAAALHRWAANDKKGAVKQGIPDYTCMEGESL